MKQKERYQTTLADKDKRGENEVQHLKKQHTKEVWNIYALCSNVDSLPCVMCYFSLVKST